MAEDGEVTRSGTVEGRDARSLAADLAEAAGGRAGDDRLRVVHV